MGKLDSPGQAHVPVIASPVRPLLLLLSIACLAACGRGQDEGRAGAGATETKYPLEGELGLLLRSAYVGKAADRPHGQWLDEFERSTRCHLVVSTADSDEEFAAKIRRDAVDVVIADGVVGLQLIQGGVVQPLDPRRLPALSGIDPRFGAMPWLAPFGVRQGLPFQAGMQVLLYDTSVFPGPVTSWSVLYQGQDLPDGKSNVGRIQSHGVATSVADAAMFLKTRRPELGIDDPFELDERQFSAALALLRSQRPLLQRYWNDEAVQRQEFRAGGVAAMSATVRQFDRLRADGASVAMTVPVEGSTGWIDVAMLKAGARHPNCAYAFMAWTLKPRVQAQVSAAASTMPVIASICRDGKLLDPARCAELGAGALDRIDFGHLPVARCSRRSACVPYSRWLADFQALGSQESVP